MFISSSLRQAKTHPEQVTEHRVQSVTHSGRLTELFTRIVLRHLSLMEVIKSKQYWKLFFYLIKVN